MLFDHGPAVEDGAEFRNVDSMRLVDGDASRSVRRLSFKCPWTATCGAPTGCWSVVGEKTGTMIDHCCTRTTTQCQAVSIPMRF